MKGLPILRRLGYFFQCRVYKIIYCVNKIKDGVHVSFNASGLSFMNDTTSFSRVSREVLFCGFPIKQPKKTRYRSKGVPGRLSGKQRNFKICIQYHIKLAIQIQVYR